MPNNCWPCKQGLHEGCAAEVTSFASCDCLHDSAPPSPRSEIGAALEDDTTGLSGSEEDETGKKPNFKRKLKNNDAVTDQLSTGRKRAALLFPLKNEDGSPKPCEFARRYSVLPVYTEQNMDGCGIRQGTATGIAQARHHLNYDTLDNSEENVVRICHSCHNKLHALNDPYKDKIYQRIYGFTPKKEDLSHAAKALRSGVVTGGVIKEDRA